MKKFLFIALASFVAVSVFAQSEYITKNRYVPIEINESIGGVWAGSDTLTEVADSVYLNKTGVPNFGDLYVPDLELKMKSLWYGTKLYFLFRHLDDSLVNGRINDAADNSVKPGIENLDATSIYLFLADSDSSFRYDPNSDMYVNDTYHDSLAWCTWVWGTDEFEGQVRGGDTIRSISALGGEMVQWEEGNYRYAKLSVDMALLAPDFTGIDTLINYDKSPIDTIIGQMISIDAKFGFEVKLNENDKELLEDGLFGLQTRAYLFNDLDSVPLDVRNVPKWGLLDISLGDYCYDCEEPSFIKPVLSNFASIYPNPASSYIQVQIEDYAEVDYRIVDLMGRVIETGTLVGKENTIKLENIHPGTYYLNMVTDDNKVMTKKLLIFN